MTRIAVLQMTSGTDPAENARVLVDAIERAAARGASMLFTPEMSGMLDRDRKRAAGKIVPEEKDPVLSAVQQAAAVNGVWVALGSLAISRASRPTPDSADETSRSGAPERGASETPRDDARWANRSLVVDAQGRVVARYDKIHMFDVTLETGESWRESASYEPGDSVVALDTPVGRLGLSVCYDLRFPALFEELGRRFCDIIAIPAAFTVPTGKAHWHLLQRARAVEASAYVVAAAQVGEHEDGRRTYGHSLVVDPWGEVVLDMGGGAPGLGFADIDPERIASTRMQLPSLANRQPIPRSR